MISEWIRHSIKQNPITFILIGTVIMGFSYDFIEWSDNRFTHFNGNEGVRMGWFAFFVMHYIIGFALVLMRLIDRISSLDKDVVISYFIFDFLGFVSYLYQGWPEPKEAIIIGFCISCLTLLSLRIWNYLK